MRNGRKRNSIGLGGTPGALAAVLLWSVLSLPAFHISPAAAGEQARADAVSAGEKQRVVESQLLSRLDAPLLFVKRHSYQGIHIYDTFYKWPPGGGGMEPSSR